MKWFSVAGALSVPAFGLATVASHSGLAPWYVRIREPMLGLSFGEMAIGRPALSWVNLALMSVVLFVVALECLRGLAEEELTGADRLRLPVFGAMGGMLAAGAVHALLARAQEGAGPWWVASMGTDLALGLAVLSLLGERVPGALKTFFSTMAMFSLLGSAAVLVAAQGALPSWPVLSAAGACLAVLLVMRLVRVNVVSPYLLTGAVLWTALAVEGCQALLAGPLTALFVPARSRDVNSSPLQVLEQDLLPTACCAALPLWVFVCAGTAPLGAPDGAMSTQGALATFLGMFPAKAAGIFGACWIGTRLRLCSLPAGTGWKEFAGAALLGGAGFTVNVFLGLAVVGLDGPQVNEIRLAATASSALSLAGGYAVLRYVLARRRNKVIQRS